MPNEINSLTIAAAPANQIADYYRAVAMPLPRIQTLMQRIVVNTEAPHFSGDQEPTQDGVFYHATDGQVYYRPRLRVAHQDSRVAGPDVRFLLRDASGAVWFQFRLVEDVPADRPEGARPFVVEVASLVLRWNGGERVFAEPSLDQSADALTLTAGTDVAPGDVDTLVRALKTGATLDVSLTFSYWLEASSTPPARPRKPWWNRYIDVRPPIIVDPGDPPPDERVVIPDRIVNPHIIGRGDLRRIARVTAQPRLDFARALNSEQVEFREQNLIAAQAEMVQPMVVPQRYAATFTDRVELSEMLAADSAAKAEPNHRSGVISITLNFTFDPSLAQNRLIYRAIESRDMFSGAWMPTIYGTIRGSTFPNTIYRLPDEIRLAYHAGLGTPYMIPTLYTGPAPAEETRVRVTMRAMPWHDPEQVVKLRDYLQKAYPGALLAPGIVTGAYKQAQLELTTAFPEDIQTLFGTSQEVDLAGFDLILDVSLEFYRYLCQLMVQQVGLTGRVEVTVEVETPADADALAEHVFNVPLNLRLDRVATIPVAINVEADTISPDQVEIANEAGTDIRIRNCTALLLQYDENSVLPMGAFPASTKTVFPTTLAHNGQLSLQFAPLAPDPVPIWNAVDIVLDQELVAPAAQVLDRIHEVAPSRTLQWKITISCPLFDRLPLPAEWKDLFAIEVEITRTGFAPQRVILNPESPSGAITMQRTLDEIVSRDSSSLPGFSYRVRNAYTMHQGQWSEPREEQGSNLFIFPNRNDND